MEQPKQDCHMVEYDKGSARRLLVGYADDRAKKDAYNREKGIRRLEKAYKHGALTKGNINKRGYICICFVALKIYKEQERMLKVSEIKMSVDKVLALAKTITIIQIKLPLNKEVYTQTMLMARHQKIANSLMKILGYAMTKSGGKFLRLIIFLFCGKLLSFIFFFKLRNRLSSLFFEETH